MLKNKTYITQIQRLEELNDRIYERNIPSINLPSNINTRSVSTKYSKMPIYDIRKDFSTLLDKHNPYIVEESFNPGTSKGPFNGFASNINNESRLRNQYFAIQNCEKSVYVPSSTSDMYEVNVSGRNEIQPHKDLFLKNDLGNFNPNKYNIGGNIFNNYTRQQIKEI
tara:strand:+ start:4716 stop:5216 length:501 start_codon:yes stop_codon:yes gene_type:complete